MRVAYVCTDVDVPAFGHGLQSTTTREMCGAMLDSGFEVTLFVSHRGGTVPGRLAGAKVIDLKTPLSRKLSGQREIVSANGDVAQALADAGPFDLIYERAGMWSMAPMQYAAASSALGVLELHPQTIRDIAALQPASRSGAARALFASALRLAHVVVTTSQDAATEAETLTEGKVKTHLIPPGCDPRGLVQEAAGGTRKDFVIGFVGPLVQGAGLDTLIDALATVVAISVPHAQLLIVGDGPQRGEISARAARRGLADRVTIVSDAGDDLPSLLARMNVAVAPHTDEHAEVWPSLTECMAAGLPTIASKTQAFESVLRDDHTGVLFRPGDAKSLASALGRLHADPLRRRHVGHEARAYAAAHFTWRKSLDRILELAAAPAH